LKSYLSGGALTLVKQIPITNENYSEAWYMMETRYKKNANYPITSVQFLNVT